MTETKQVIPSWLQTMGVEARTSAGLSRRNGNKGGRFSGGFGSRDYRSYQPVGQARQETVRYNTNRQAPSPARSTTDWWDQ